MEPSDGLLLAAYNGDLDTLQAKVSDGHDINTIDQVCMFASDQPRHVPQSPCALHAGWPQRAALRITSRALGRG